MKYDKLIIIAGPQNSGKTENVDFLCEALCPSIRIANGKFEATPTGTTIHDDVTPAEVASLYNIRKGQTGFMIVTIQQDAPRKKPRAPFTRATKDTASLGDLLHLRFPGAKILYTEPF